MKIVVLAGGLSPERNVSLSSGAKVTQALCRLGHKAVMVDQYVGLENWNGELEACFDQPFLTGESEPRISREAPDLEQVKNERRDKSDSLFGPSVLQLCRLADAVFIALHGASGEDGRVQAAFDLLGIDYTGSGYLSAAVAMNKELTKRIVSGHVKTPKWTTIRYSPENLETLAEESEYPLVVKPVDGGSSLGVSIVHSAEELRSTLSRDAKEGDKLVLEQYIAGREIQVGILEDWALPPIEIIPQQSFYDYESKYQPGAAREICPARIPPELEEKLCQDAVTVYRELGMSVYARADFIVDDEGEIWFLEINTLPGMTPTSLLPQEAAAAGIDYPHLCQQILDVSVEQRREEREGTE
ncbi:MAG: D-alanine--D-alanine ligase [Oscillospiraceae bacterium]|nr:D-alanine--D-alanine ligase [Oscillospiraceae bacterium]